MRTITPSSVAGKPSIKTSSSSSSTSLRRRGPGGRTLSERTSWVLMTPGGPGLIASLEDPAPARRRDGFGLGGGGGLLVGALAAPVLAAERASALGVRGSPRR